MSNSFCDLMDCRLSMGFSRQEYWNGLQFPSPGDLTDVGINPVSPALAGDSLPLSHLGSSIIKDTRLLNYSYCPQRAYSILGKVLQTAAKMLKLHWALVALRIKSKI